MRRGFPLLLAALLLLLPAVCASAPAAGESAVDALQPVLSAVVNISTWKTTSSGAERGTWTRSFGSGFIIDPAGVIVTNRHVIDKAELVSVTFSDGTQAVATVTALGGALDLALLRVNVDHKLPAVTFGDSDKLRIGEPVFTIGNPLALGTSVSAGIVSALDRDIRKSPYDAFIQTDAAINHGNSGGPLVNAKGEVVGVDTALISPTEGSAGLGFAITSNDTEFVVGRLRSVGKVQAGWIGARLQDVTGELADATGLDRPGGAIVVFVDVNGPAMQAGIKAGDILTAVDGTRYDDPRGVMRAFARIGVGQRATVTEFRDGMERQIQLTIAEFPGDDVPSNVTGAAATLAAIAERPDFGMKLNDVNGVTRSRYESAVKSGVVVTSVDPDSAAGAAGLVPGDVILQVQNVAVTNPAEFEQAAEMARKLGRDFVAMLVQKKDGLQWVAVLSRPPAPPSP